jgi:hypothetical protein
MVRGSGNESSMRQAAFVVPAVKKSEQTSRLPGAIAIAACALVLVGGAAAPSGLSVDVVNHTQPVLCAEKDNVTLALSSAAVRSFRIEALHPAYSALLQRDSVAPDWTACDFSADPAFETPQQEPRTVTLYKGQGVRLVGHTYARFWRPATATVRVGQRVERNLHLIQVVLLTPRQPEEVLVLYPQDGYFRLRPLTPRGIPFTAYGSSFLVGPIEEEGRPFVQIEEVVFEPKARRLTLRFVRGGSATLELAEANRERSAVDVVFDRPQSGGPFAMLRSMYVTEFNNDVARIAVREPGAQGWREESITRFTRASATDLWTGRLTPSRHNTSSPDIVFHGFSSTDQPNRPERAHAVGRP